MRRDGGGHWNRAARRSGGNRAAPLISPQRPQKFIVKLQVSLASTHRAKQVLIYNRDRSVEWTGDAGADVLTLMGDEPKAFFWAIIREDGRVSIEGVAPWQEW